MLAWLSANLVNIWLILVVAAVLALVIRIMVRDRKAGKSSCGGDCAACGCCKTCKDCIATKENRS